MKAYRLETTQGDEIGMSRGIDADDAKDRWARGNGYDSFADAVADEAVEAEIEISEMECNGHPGGTNGVMGQTIYCDGSCR